MSSAENLERVLFDIAGRATTLGERLQRGTVPQRAGIDDAVVQKRLEMWCQAVAKGDWASFGNV